MDLRGRKALAVVSKELENANQEFSRMEDRYLVTLRERDEAIQKAHELEVKNAVLVERLDLLTSGVLEKPAAPQTWTEDVEDAEYLFRTGRLDKAEFEAALEAAGFQNTEIAFDSGSLPRI